MMQSLIDSVAQNPTLQALSIAITIGGFIIFVFKLMIPAIRFAIIWAKDGFKRASIRSVRKILKRVRRDSRHLALLNTSLAQMGLSAFIGIFTPFVGLIVLQAMQENMEKLKLIDDVIERPTTSEIVFSLLFILPVGAGLAWLFLFPFIRLFIYIRLMRRHVLRQIRVNR